MHIACGNGLRCLLLLAVSFLCSCVTAPQSYVLKIDPPEGITRVKELKHIPFFPQEDYQCGPAALATLLVDKGITTSPDELVPKVYIPARKGSLQIEMIATARSFGLMPYKLEPQLLSMLREVDHGNPVLVFQNLAFNFWPKWHFAVVAGYDLEKQELLLRSGTYREYRMSFSTFERTWQRVGHWAYILVRPGDIPVTAMPLNYTKASHQLDLSGFKNEALTALRSGASKWPDESIVLMALGNAEYAAGNYKQSSQAFLKEISLDQSNANAWNNLAYSEAARNCKSAAIKAVQCALALKPDDPNIQSSAREIESMRITEERGCPIPECMYELKINH